MPRLHRLAAQVAVLVTLPGLVACQNLVSKSDLYYNTGLADGRNGVILTNIVRAAKGYPTYFSAVGDFSRSRSAGSSPTLSIDPGISGGDPDLNIGFGPTLTNENDANVSSLETNDFVQAMHSSIPPTLFLSLAESRDRAHLHLTLMLLTKAIQVTTAEYERVISLAWQNCNDNINSLPGTLRGICLNFDNGIGAPNCPGVLDIPSDAPPTAVVRLRNDPSAPCRFDQFRTFVEALVVLEPKVQVGGDSEKKTVVIGSELITVPPRDTFSGPDIGYELRSPNELVYYLGQIVRESHASGTAKRFSLSTRDGRDAPIILVEDGPDNRRSSVKVTVDGTTYWVRRQELGGPERDFSHRALAITKDLIVLNTSQNQLATNNTIILDSR